MRACIRVSGTYFPPNRPNRPKESGLWATVDGPFSAASTAVGSRVRVQDTGAGGGIADVSGRDFWGFRRIRTPTEKGKDLGREEAKGRLGFPRAEPVAAAMGFWWALFAVPIKYLVPFYFCLPSCNFVHVYIYIYTEKDKKSVCKCQKMNKKSRESKARL